MEKKKRSIEDLLLVVSIMLVYIISGKLGLTLAFVNASATAIWPPTGIAIASFLIFGYRVWPAIFFGAFFTNITTAGSIATSLGIATGNTVEGLTAAYLVNKYANGRNAFDHPLDIFKFGLYAAMYATMIGATVGTTSLALGGYALWIDYWSIWFTWWLGDLAGALIVAPFILIWSRHKRFRWERNQLIEVAITLVLLLIIGITVFGGKFTTANSIYPLEFLCIPILVWTAFRFGRRETTTAILILSAIAVWGTLRGYGPFARLSQNESLLLLQSFMAVISVTALSLAAAVLERKNYEKRFRVLIEKSYDAVSITDLSGSITYVSSSFSKILGFEPEEVQGKRALAYIHPDDIEYVRQVTSPIGEGQGKSVTYEIRCLHKDGSVRYLEITTTNLTEEPSIRGVVSNFHDITARKREEDKQAREKAKDEAMLASIGDGIIGTDNTGKITRVNTVALEALGWKEEDLLNKFMIETIPMQDETGRILPASERPLTKVLLEGKKIVTSKTNYYLKKDKTTFPVRFTITPIILEKSIIGTIEVFHDITKEKELDRMKDEFISMASHELRTPMTAVKGFLSMIFQGDYGPINQGLNRPLKNIQDSAQRQIHLINDLLDASRLQTGRMMFELIHFPVRRALDEVVRLLMPLAQQKGITLTLENNEEIRVQGDIEWTKRILNNLIGNAIKFTDAGGIIVSYTADRANVHIAIIDTGAGIEPAGQQKLFGKFQQISTDKSTKPPGTGLGLYLSRELARKMGGEVELKTSVPGHGSTFVFSLPKADSPAAGKIKSGLAREAEIAFSQKNA